MEGKPSFSEPGISGIPSDAAVDDGVGETGQEQLQRRTPGGQGRLELLPTPPHLGMG